MKRPDRTLKIEFQKDNYTGDKLQPRKAGAVKPYIKRKVKTRDKFKCQKCGSTDNLEIHHVRRKYYGGRGIPRNLITLCTHCHARLHADNIGVTVKAK